MMERRVKCILDSGAYSAWGQGIEIDLRDYIRYVQEHKHLLESYVNLDSIPAKKTLEAREAAARQSYKNQQVMKEAGLHPIPVFHQGENWLWLEKMLKDGETYIGLSTGGQHRQPRPSIYRWLDQCFSRLCDAQGRPLVRIHGFGITSRLLLLRYPCTTVDSTTWELLAGYGQIVVPMLIGNEFDYKAKPLQVRVADMENLSELDLDQVNRYVKSCGLTMAEVRYSSAARRLMGALYYKELREALPDIRFGHHRPGVKPSVNYKPPSVSKVTIVMATQLWDHRWSHVLTNCEMWDRLVSYYEATSGYTKRRRIEGGLERFVTTGTADVKPEPGHMRWREGKVYWGQCRVPKLPGAAASEESTVL